MRLLVIYSPWSIVTVPFPFTDKDKSKKRPSLVISTSSFATNHQHLILLMITSSKNSLWPSDMAITDLANAGLPVPCVVRFKAFTLDSKLILSKIGELVAGDRQRVLATMPTVLATGNLPPEKF